MLKGTITYTHSTNLGDYIQTIAAAQLLGPGPFTHLDRESLHLYDGPDLQLLVNGWFMQNPSHWPPAKAISPLFLSFHINPTAADLMLSPAGLTYLKKHQPIGCRDEYTRQLLEYHQIQAYLSACVTLTLKRSSFVSNQTPRKGILVLSALDRMVPNTQELWEQKKTFPWAVQQLKAPLKRFKAKQANKRLQTFLSQQNRLITSASQILKSPLQNSEEYLAAAWQQLEKIACAEVVITSRIHTALPAVALGTPVVFLNDGLEHPNQASRLDGLLDLFTVCNTKNLTQIKLENLIPSDKHWPFVRLINKKTTAFFSLK